MDEQGSRPRLSVVMPVYNERATLEEILHRVQSVNINKEIILIDDCSRDGSRELLQQLAIGAAQSPPAVVTLTQTGHPLRTDNIRVFFHEKNRGKGVALRRGFQEARGELVVVQDADLEYDPQEYFKLLEPIEKGMADVVYGSRFLGGSRRVLYFWHYVTNRFLTLLSDVFTGLYLSDVWTCYKVFRREVLQGIELREDRFGFEPEVTAKLAAGNWRIYEVPISYWARTHAEGKKIDWQDGLRALWCIWRYR